MMKHYYSIASYSTVSIQYREPLIFIEPGINAFTVLTDDIKKILNLLKEDGIQITGVHQLDECADEVPLLKEVFGIEK